MGRQKMSSPLLILAAVLVSAASAQRNCDGVGFKSDAEQFVSARFKEQNRRGNVKKEVTAIEVAWQPQNMLDDMACFDLTQTALLYRTTDAGEWAVADTRQRAAGQSAKWTLAEVKPCLRYQFAIKVTGESEAILQLTASVGPAEEQEIVDSGFVPSAPSGFEAEGGANMATLRWDAVDCAAKYELSVNEAGSNEYSFKSAESNQIQLEGLKFCTNYEATINALSLGDEYSSDLIVNFKTKPRMDAAKDLDVKVEATMDSAVITWDTWKSVSCIGQYQITICPVGGDTECLPTEIVDKPTGLPTITYSVSGLLPCMDYNLKIQPLYVEEELEEKMVAFRTLSPSVDSVSVGQVGTESVSSGSMMVSWPSVKCATTYKIFQQETSGYDDWTLVAETEDLAITVDNLTPCTEYHFGVAAVLDGQETVKSEGPAVMSQLDEEDPFEAPNLVIENADRHVDVSWQHANCIESYVINICHSAYTDCVKVEVAPAYGEKQVTKRIEDLEPCTHYSLEVVPIITGKTFTARQNDFTTTNGTPAAPLGFKTQMSGNNAALNWESVQCATGYKIYHRIGDGPEASEVTQALSEEYADPTPCLVYYYSVATLVGEQESDRTEWQSLLVPPRAEIPALLKVVSNENDNITLSLEPTGVNDKCVPEQYELSYTSNGYEPYMKSLVDPADSKDGYIELRFSGASGHNALVVGRIKYADSDVWSGAARSREIGDLSQMPRVAPPATTIIPIVIGIVVAVLIVVVIIVVVMVKKSKRGAGYDAEKAGSSGANGRAGNEETQKLNENHPEA